MNAARPVDPMVKSEVDVLDTDRYGPWAIILGGSEGLGREYGQLLAAGGVNLLLVARSEDRLAAAAADIRAAAAVEMRTLAADLATEDGVARVMTAVRGLDIGLAIYNAGGATTPRDFVDAGADDALAQIRLNVTTMTTLCHHFGRAMKARGRGGLLLVGSMSCVAGSTGLAVYGASKAYTLAFGEALWSELAPAGVDVLALVVGRMKTPALERAGLDGRGEVPAADPADIARDSLAQLRCGPVMVQHEHRPGFDALRAMPRDKAVAVMARSLRSQTG